MSLTAAKLDYETNYEDALAVVLAAALSGVQILTPRTLLSSAPILTTPRVTIGLQVTGTNPNQQATDTTSGLYDAHKLGVFTLAATVRRDGTGQSLGTLRGGIRLALLKGATALNATNLPNYQTITLREQGSAMSPGAENDEITCQLNYAVEFYVIPG